MEFAAHRFLAVMTLRSATVGKYSLFQPVSPDRQHGEPARFPPHPAHTAAMRKRVQIALVVLLAMLAGVIGWRILREREPSYQGRQLSSWLEAYGRVRQTTESEFRRKTYEALKQIGTNAIPASLRMLRAKDSALNVKLMELAKGQHFIKFNYTSAQELNQRAFWVFEVLGPKARSAVPALIEIANQNISRSSQHYAIDALGYLGEDETGYTNPSAKEAVPSLLGWATNEDWHVRSDAILALGRIGAEPDRVLPVLINALHDPNLQVQLFATICLGHFRRDAKNAVPALVEVLNASQGGMVKSAASRALKAIDPEAAAKAGVK
jgi:HEAT repeat protein